MVALVRLFLVDARTDQVLQELVPGTAIARSTFPGKSFAIVAVVDPSINAKSVVFRLNGVNVRNENTAPYALFSDNNGDITGGNLYADGSYTFEVTAYSKTNGGGTVLASTTVPVVVGDPRVAFNTPIAGDGILNAVESDQDLSLSGTATNVENGRTVTVTVGGVAYTATVAAGAWSLTVPAAAVSTQADGSYALTAAVSNAGGAAAVPASLTLRVDTTADADANVNLTIPDTLIDVSELANVAVTVGGLDADAHGVVTFSDGTTSVSVSVAANGTVTADLSALASGQVTTSLAVTDTAGNAVTVSGGSLTIDRSIVPLPVLTLNTPIAGDGIVNGAEAGQGVTIAGTAAYVADGGIVTVSFGGATYTGTVAAGAWSVAIPAASLSGLANGSHALTATTSNSAGTRSVNTTIGVDTTADAGADLSLAFPDTRIDANELANVATTIGGLDADASGVLTFSDGTTSVSVSVIANGTVRADLRALADGPVTTTLAVTDTAGNTATRTGGPLTIDRPVAPVANNDAFTTQVGVVIQGSVLLNDTDANGDVLTASLITGPAHGTLVLNANGTFTYTPDSGFSGDDSFLYRASDGLRTDTATATIIVSRFATETVVSGADGAHSVQAADIDGDGDLDLLVALKNENRLAWYRNDGSEHFTRVNLPQDLKGAFDATAVDLDGDGDMDLVGVGYTGNRLRWYENDGNENFTSRLVTSSLVNIHSVSAVDVDGDGDLDLVSAVQAEDRVVWFDNNGAESFTVRTAVAGVDGVREAHTVDFDGDGDIDILTASVSDDKVAWHENNGSGGFTTHVVSTSADGARSVTSGDIDGDGDLDVLAASTNDDSVRWYENLDGFNFATHLITNHADSARSVRVGDLDGDGDLDVASASGSDNAIRWYENDGAGHFVTHALTTTLGGAVAVSLADVNGDGHLDVLAAGETADAILAFFSQPGDPPLA